MKSVKIEILMPITISVDVSDEIVALIKEPWENLSAQDHRKFGAFLATLPHHADISYFEIDGEKYSS